MRHRHLTHEQFTLAAIDDVIARGRQRDWADLRRAALEDRAVLENVRRVCRAHVSDPYAQRYHFWLHYAEEHLADPSPNLAMHKTWALGVRQGNVEPIMVEGGFRLISVGMVGPALAPSGA